MILSLQLQYADWMKALKIGSNYFLSQGTSLSRINRDSEREHMEYRIPRQTESMQEQGRLYSYLIH